MGKKYSNFLTVLLVIIIIAIVGVIGFMGYKYYKTYIDKNSAEDFVEILMGKRIIIIQMIFNLMV